MKCNRLKLQTIGVCLTGALVTGSSVTSAQAAPAPESARLEKLENENKTLRERLEALEIKEGITSTSKTPDNAVKMLSGAKLSGFVTASYFYDFSQPKDGVSNGYLWSPDHNSFTINKVKLVLEKPAEKSGDKFDAGYHIAMTR